MVGRGSRHAGAEPVVSKQGLQGLLPGGGIILGQPSVSPGRTLPS
jgi:hypothetical protein